METMGGSLEDLRAFCAVVELGSISAAARQLETTKGGLSRRVSRLERRLRVRLLARTPRAVSPTEEGNAFHAKARDALALLDEAAGGARSAQTVPRGHLRVTAPVDIGVELLPALLVRFRELHPQITVELLLSDAPLDLAAQRIDLALRATVHDLPDMGYRASIIIEFPIAWYASPEYLARHRAPARPQELPSHAIVAALASGTASRIAMSGPRGRREAISLRAPIRTSDFASASRLVQAGGGIGALPEVIVAGAVHAGRLVRVLPDWTLARARLHAITVAGREAPARVRVFREFVREHLAQLCPPGREPRPPAHP